MDKILKLYTYVDGGVDDTPFPNSDNPIEIGTFSYDAKRMGGAPIITASVNYPSCLDDEWTDNVYAEFNGEKYYLKQTPTSSYDNQDEMYKHDLTLVSERVALDNVYFFDVVTGNPMDSDKPVSNSTKVVFFGDVREFASRLQASLEYSELDYTVVVDEYVISEEKLMSFEDQFFSNVLQEIYNTYEVPYYFVGKTIHIGDYNKLSEDEQLPVFSYGVDDALLSITKNNANYKIVNRATGTGSSDNIPFYYPNNSPKGEIAATTSGNFKVKIIDAELYSNEIKLDGVIRKSNVEYENAKATFGGEEIYSGETFSAQMGAGGINNTFGISFTSKDAGVFLFSFSSSVTRYILKEEEKTDATFGIRYFVKVYDRTAKKYTYDSKGSLSSIENFEVQVPYANHEYSITIECHYAPEGKYSGKGGQIVFNASYSFGAKSGWMYEDKVIDLKDVGLEVVGNTVAGDTITQNLVKYVNTSKSLMPFKYRETDGKERFYNATNDTYEGVTFNNPFVKGNPKEHIITVEDIKPSIKEMVNSMGLRMDMFSEFAYDLDDNDELIENENESQHEYVHSYFFAKLRKLDFNLFDHAIEQQPMVISFTSGDCGACNFTIGVTEEFPQKNPVQVNADGTLKRDEKGRVVCGQFEEIAEDECQPQQQDTINNEVWIALKKEDSTYGILMPKSPKFNENGEQIESGHRPKACSAGENDGDTFVILGINLPLSYILNAEKKLEAEIIKYLKDNNDEKFTFSISFSRIYFAENPDILPLLSENSKIRITYNNKEYDLYVSSFSYSMGDNDVLPEIKVELDDTLKVSQNALQNAISEVRSSLGSTINEVAQAVAMQKRSYVSKIEDDNAQGVVNFTKGIKFGEGGKVEVMDNNSAKLTIEYLEVTKKASFTSLEIQEKTHVGGQIIISPAAMTCGEVEELNDVYRCYFQTKGEDNTDEIFNQFAINDLAICQTYNSWGSRYYWRKVVGIGNDYIDLSKTLCDEDSGIPMSGDKIIQLGNTEDATRQAAQVLSAYGEDAPSFIMYNGIDDFSLVGKNITGIIWNPETQEPQMYSYGSFFFGDRELNDNFITFQKKEGDTEKTLSISADVTIGANSSGLTNLSEWKEAEQSISDAQSAAKEAQSSASEAKRVAAATSVIIDEWSSDGIISPVEKQSLRNELASVLSDYEDIKKQYEKYIQEFEDLILIDGKYYITEDGYQFNVEVAYEDWEAFKVAKNAYVAELESKINTEGNVEVGDLTVKQETYYSTKTTILEDIALSIKADADDSKQQARQAQESVNNVNDTLDSWTADGVISPVEKQALRNEKAQVYNEYDSIYNDVVRYQIENQLWEEYETQYSLYLQEIERAITLDEVISAEELTSRQTSYYQARTEILDAIESAAKSKVDGMEYLTKLFGKGNNLSVTGGVLAQMLAVSNDENEIEAFLNGSQVGEDDTHGKLLLAAGIDDITKVEEASTKIYEDGTIYSERLVLEDGCKIGSLVVTNKGISVEEGCLETPLTSKDYARFNDDGFKVSRLYNTGSSCATRSSVDIRYDGLTVVGNSNYSDLFAAYEVYDSIIGFHAQRTKTGYVFGRLTINEEESMTSLPDDTYSIYATSGKMAGLRPNLTNPATNSQLGALDHTVIITNGVLFLPDSPVDGQEYKILHTSSAELNITNTSTGKINIWDFKNSNTKSYSIQSTSKEVIEMIYNELNQTWYAHRH